MTKIAFAILLLCSAVAWAGDPNPSEYTINIHVSSSRLMIEPVSTSTSNVQRLGATIDGKKYELESVNNGRIPFTLGSYRPIVLALGDYKAKLVEDEHKPSYESYQVYELLFPDNKRARFVVVGQSE